MNTMDFLNQRFCITELNALLLEIMGYSANIKLGNPEQIEIYDEDGCLVKWQNIIGYKDITILRNIILLKEIIDYKRGELQGKITIQQNILKELGL